MEITRKKIIFIVLILVAVVLVIYKVTPFRVPQKTYTNSTYGFTFSYPQTLFLSALVSTTTATSLSDVTFLSIKKDSTYRDTNFFVVSYAPTVGIALANFPVSTTTPQHLSDYVLYYKAHQKDFPNFPAQSSWSEEVANNVKYYKLTAPDLQSYLIEHNGVYFLTFSTVTPENKKFTKYIPQILYSFKFDR